MRARMALSRRARRPAGGRRFFAEHQCILENAARQWPHRPSRQGRPTRRNLPRTCARNILGIAAPPAHIIRRRQEQGPSRRLMAIGAPTSGRVKGMVKLIRFLFICAVIVAIAGRGFIGITIWYFGRDLPDYQQLADYQPPIMTRVQAGDGRLLAEYATERRVFVPIQAIPKQVIRRLHLGRGQELLHPSRRSTRCRSCAPRLPMSADCAAAAARSGPRPSPSRSPRTCC